MGIPGSWRVIRLHQRGTDSPVKRVRKPDTRFPGRMWYGHGTEDLGPPLVPLCGLRFLFSFGGRLSIAGTRAG